MASPEKITPQQKLKMKMVSIDTWSIREQLCLASSVLRSGDQNWVSVSRSLRSFAEPNRPQDWLSPRNCALQYNSLLEKTGAHKRKRGERHPSSGSTDSQQGETPGEIILRQLTQERIDELQQLLESSRRDYQLLKKELDLVQDGKLDDKLHELCEMIDEENERKLNEQKLHLKWLEERERKLQELKQAQQMLLRSPAKVFSHPEAIEVEIATSSPSVTDQLNIDVTTEEVREAVTTPADTKTPTTATPTTPAATPSSPLLTSLLRSPTAPATSSANKPIPSASAAKTLFTLASPSAMSPGLKNLVSTAIGEETSPVKATPAAEGSVAPTLTRLLELPPNSPGKPLPELTVEEETEVATAPAEPVASNQEPEEDLPEKMDETPAIEEESVEIADVAVEIESKPTEEEIAVEEKEVEPTPEIEEPVDGAIKKEEEPIVTPEVVPDKPEIKEEPEEMVAFESEVEVSQIEEPEVEKVVVTIEEPISKPEPIEEEEVVQEEEEKVVEEAPEDSGDEKAEEKELKPPEVDVSTETTTPKLIRRPLRGIRRKVHNRESESADEKAKEAGPTTRRSSGRKGQPSEEPETETGEESTTEANPPKTVEKKKILPPPLNVPTTSPAPSSGIDSIPNSPTSSVSTVAEDDRDYKTWKKSILLVWREISSHKNASLFAKPITEESVPGYRSMVMRPMDLSTVKKNIESGAIRSTVEFQRDISLMFFNSIMYNPTYHEVNRLAREMYGESATIIHEFVNAQLLAAHNMESTRPHRRETRDLARRTESLSSHEETPSKPEEGKTRAAKRASAAATVDESTITKTKRRSRLQNE